MLPDLDEILLLVLKKRQEFYVRFKGPEESMSDLLIPPQCYDTEVFQSTL